MEEIIQWSSFYMIILANSGHYILHIIRQKDVKPECFTIIELAFFLQWLVRRRLLGDIGAQFGGAENTIRDRDKVQRTAVVAGGGTW